MERKFKLPENLTLGQLLLDRTSIDFHISGGMGSSIEDAIIMEITKRNDFIRREYQILEHLFYIRSLDYQVIKQSLIEDGDKKYDCIKISYELSGKKYVEEFYFEITDCFRKKFDDIGNGGKLVGY
jgi:endonuclease III-like uncharacterized protein